MYLFIYFYQDVKDTSTFISFENYVFKLCYTLSHGQKKFE